MFLELSTIARVFETCTMNILEVSNLLSFFATHFFDISAILNTFQIFVTSIQKSLFAVKIIYDKGEEQSKYFVLIVLASKIFKAYAKKFNALLFVWQKNQTYFLIIQARN